MRAVAWFFAILLATSVQAHPGSAIVVDKLGQVYFLDTGAGLWKIDAKGVLTHIGGSRFHWMTIDADDAFKSVKLPSGADGDVERAGTAPTLLLASDYPLTMGEDGNLYYPSRASGGSLNVLKLTRSGRTSTLTSLRLPWLNGLATGPSGFLYFTENSAIRRISAQGQVSTVVETLSLTGCASIPGNDPKDPLLRGLAIDASGTVYVAASGCGRVLKVERDGKISTLSQTQSPWSPTAVALFGKDVYVLEYLHTEVEDRQLWIPRVRKITPDGKSAIIAAVTRR